MPHNLISFIGETSSSPPAEPAPGSSSGRCPASPLQSAALPVENATPFLTVIPLAVQPRAEPAREGMEAGETIMQAQSVPYIDRRSDRCHNTAAGSSAYKFDSTDNEIQ